MLPIGPTFENDAAHVSAMSLPVSSDSENDTINYKSHRLYKKTTLCHGNVECHTNVFENRSYNIRPPAIGTEHNRRRLMIVAGELIDGQFSNRGKTRDLVLYKKMMIVLQHY